MQKKEKNTIHKPTFIFNNENPMINNINIYFLKKFQNLFCRKQMILSSASCKKYKT